MTDAILVLEDGSVFEGIAAGAPGEVVAEVVFNTSMTGYQEILTDPSYAGQILTFTSPHIGNYGVCDIDSESMAIPAAGFIVREIQPPSNYRSEVAFEEWTKSSGLVGITDVDTRALTRVLRDTGVMMGAIVHGATKDDAASIVERIKSAPDYASANFVQQVATDSPYLAVVDSGKVSKGEISPKSGTRVACIDFGVKLSILESMASRKLEVVVVPPNATVETLSELEVDGVMVSNGPGDPSLLGDFLPEVKRIAETFPTFGICLGHQLLAAAFGAQTYKLPFGHRGPNQPVIDYDEDRVIITSQNHGYAVVEESMPEVFRVTQRNLNDDTIEGIAHKTLPIKAVQYHPEAGPGPNDAQSFFDDFARSLNNR